MIVKNFSDVLNVAGDRQQQQREQQQQAGRLRSFVFGAGHRHFGQHEH